MKKLLVVTLVLILVAWTSTAMAVQMVWEESNNDVLAFDGDNVQTAFYNDDEYTVEILLEAPGYNTLHWSIAGFAVDGWESEGAYVDTFSIIATLDGQNLETSTGIVVSGANGTPGNSVYFDIDLGLDGLTPPYIGLLSISTTATLTGDNEYWNLFDAELSSCDPVPEPATLLLLGSGLAGLAFLRRRKS